MRTTLLALLLVLATTNAYAEDSACADFKKDLRYAYNGMNTTAPAMNRLLSKPGIAAAIQRKKIARQGYQYATIALRSAQNLSRLNCLDLAGRKKDWTELLKEAIQIVESYRIQADAL